MNKIKLEIKKKLIVNHCTGKPITMGNLRYKLFANNTNVLEFKFFFIGEQKAFSCFCPTQVKSHGFVFIVGDQTLKGNVFHFFISRHGDV